jgi:hypothetical protein
LISAPVIARIGLTTPVAAVIPLRQNRNSDRHQKHQDEHTDQFLEHTDFPFHFLRSQESLV